MLADLGQQAQALVGMFRTIALDVWQHVQAEAIAEQGAAKHQLDTASKRAERLLDLYVNGKLDQRRYVAKAREIETEVALARCNYHDAELAELDAEIVLAEAERLFIDLPALWDQVRPDERIPLAKLLFGESVMVDQTGRCSNTHKGGLINHLGAVTHQGSTNGCPNRTDVEPVLRVLREIHQAAVFLAAA